MKLVYFSILYAFSCCCYGQEDMYGNVARNNLEAIGGASGVVRTFDNRYEGVKGTPYLFEHWKSGVLYLRNGSTIEFSKGNYNKFEDEFIFIESDRVIYIEISEINSIEIESESRILTFVTFTPMKCQSEPEGYFQVLFDGKVTLLKKYRTRFTKADYQGAYNSDSRYDEFQNKPSLYYFGLSMCKLFRVKLNKKSLSRFFKGQEMDIDLTGFDGSETSLIGILNSAKR